MSDEESKQSFLSKLRQRSAIIFTIGLAISVASFVENLHMGKAAIAFVVDELSKIQGWEDFVRATAAIFHGALEWWRGVLRDLLSFLPIEIPQWLHDPLSVMMFGLSRVLTSARPLSRYHQLRHSLLFPEEPEHAKLDRQWYSVMIVRDTIASSLLLVMALSFLIFVDQGYLDLDRAGKLDPHTAAVYITILVVFVFLFWLAVRRMNRLSRLADDAEQRSSGQGR